MSGLRVNLGFVEALELPLTDELPIQAKLLLQQLQGLQPLPVLFQEVEAPHHLLEDLVLFLYHVRGHVAHSLSGVRQVQGVEAVWDLDAFCGSQDVTGLWQPHEGLGEVGDGLEDRGVAPLQLHGDRADDWGHTVLRVDQDVEADLRAQVLDIGAELSRDLLLEEVEECPC